MYDLYPFINLITMKRLSQTLLSLTVLVIIISSCTSCEKTPPPPPPTPTTYTVSFNANGGSGSVSSQTVNSGTAITLPSGSSFTYTGYTFLNWNTASNGSGTSYSVGGSYTVTSNATLYAIWQVAGPTAVFTAVDASTSAVQKSLLGNSNAKALVVNVTTAGTAKLDVLGALTNSNPAIAYYWITNRDSSEVFQATSTLNPILAKTVASATQTINLSVGLNVICFKTALLNGAITNGATVGLKLTGASGTISNTSYTADAVSGNLAGTIKILLKVNNNIVISPNGQTTGGVYAYFQLFPYSDQAATTYDGALYPSILSVSFDTKNTSWFTGTFTGYSNLDFTNAAGGAGQNFVFNQDNNGSTSNIFQNSNASFPSGVLQFSKATGTNLVKSFLGSFAYCSTFANVYNSSSTQFGPANICWYLKSIRFVGNPELWIYAPDGTRIW